MRRCFGLEVESGRLQRFRAVAGSFSAYEHEVTIQTLGIEFSATVFFAQDSAFSRNFLGRSGWATACGSNCDSRGLISRPARRTIVQES